MHLFKRFESIVRDEIGALSASGALPAGLHLSAVAVEPPREAAHGELTTNAAMVLARPAKKPPRAIAEALAERLRSQPEVVENAVARADGVAVGHAIARLAVVVDATGRIDG